MKNEIDKLSNVMLALRSALEQLGAKNLDTKVKLELEPEQWYPLEGVLMQAAYDHTNPMIERLPLDHGVRVCGIMIGLKSENLTDKTKDELSRLHSLDRTLRDLARHVR